MKLFALYNVFNGVDLLDKSLEQIDNFCDEIVLCFQQVSNKGEKYNVFDQIRYLESDKKITLLKFEPDLSVSPVSNMKAKLQARINYAKKSGATHFFFAAEDHFYKENEFARALDWFMKGGYDASATQMYTYYKHPTWQIDPPETYWMPFLFKMYDRTKVGGKGYPVTTDPAVKVTPWSRFKSFSQAEIMMHHFSMVRKDIGLKFRNAAGASSNPDRVERNTKQYERYNPKSGEPIKYFQGRKIKVVPNYFNL